MHLIKSLGEKMNKSESITLLATALAKAQNEMKNPAFDSQNPHFRNKYASLASVRDTVTPCLSKHGLAVSQHLGVEEGMVTCETILMHSSGEWISSVIKLPTPKPDAQGFGSAYTYARRYSLMAICGVVGDEDDDANEASKPVTSNDMSKRFARVTVEKMTDEIKFSKDHASATAAWKKYEKACTDLGDKETLDIIKRAYADTYKKITAKLKGEA
jgi:hypothetical protein